MAHTLDDTRWPVVVLTATGPMDAAARREYFALVDSVLDRGRPFVLVQVHGEDVVVGDGQRGAAEMRQGIATRSERLQALCRGLYGVVLCGTRACTAQSSAGAWSAVPPSSSSASTIRYA